MGNSASTPTSFPLHPLHGASRSPALSEPSSSAVCQRGSSSTSPPLTAPRTTYHGRVPPPPGCPPSSSASHSQRTQADLQASPTISRSAEARGYRPNSLNRTRQSRSGRSSSSLLSLPLLQRASTCTASTITSPCPSSAA